MLMNLLSIFRRSISIDSAFFPAKKFSSFKCSSVESARNEKELFAAMISFFLTEILFSTIASISVTESLRYERSLLTYFCFSGNAAICTVNAISHRCIIVRAFMKLLTLSILPLLMWKVALETLPSILFVTVLVNLISCEIPTEE